MAGIESLRAGSRIDLSSRIQARPVIAGILVMLVAMGLLMTLAGGLGLWSVRTMDAEAAGELGVGFGIWASLAWIVSALFGGYVAAVAARASLRRDGLLHGLVTWAGACFLAFVAMCIWFMAAIDVDLATADAAEGFGGRGMFLGMFLADVLAAGAALIGGLLGAAAEKRAAGREEAVRDRAAAAPLRPPSPQPT